MPPHRPWGHGRPQGASHIDLRYSADALKAISDLQLGFRPRAILRIRPPVALITKPTTDPALSRNAKSGSENVLVVILLGY